MDASNQPAGESTRNDSPQISARSNMPSLATLLRWLLLFLGVGLVISSLLKNWFDIPVAAEGVVSDFSNISTQSPACQICFQVVLGLGLLGLLISWLLQKRRWSTLSTLIACSMVLIGLAFPYFVMLRSPDIAADATWLQMQHDNLTWLGGDINSAAESGQMAWKTKVYWVDPPRQIAIAPLPTWSAWEVGLDKLDDVLIWLGYSNVFCQFARPGWFHGLIGSALLVLVSLLRRKQIDLRRAGLAILYVFVLTLVGSIFALRGPFAVKALLHDAALATGDGDYKRALVQLQSCGQRFPVLTQDTNFIRQRGLIEIRLQHHSDYARLFQATTHESSGRYDQAFLIWDSLCDSDDPAIRREALRAVLRFAVQDYNSQRMILARQRLEFVLHRQPGNVKVIYFLQVLGVREQSPAEVYRMCDWMYAVTDHLNFSTTKVLKAISQQNSMMAAALDGDPDETWVRMIGARKP